VNEREGFNMTRLPCALGGLLLTAVPVAADISPRDVWDDWLASAGDAEVSTDQVEDLGDRLTVRGLSMTSGSTEDEGRYTIEVDEITLSQNEDGTVGVSLSPRYPIILTDTGEDGTTRETRLVLEHPDLGMTVAEQDGRKVHSFEAPEVRVILEDSSVEGEPLDVSGNVVLVDVDANYDVAESGLGYSRLSASRVEIAFDGVDPDGEGVFAVDMTMEGLESTNMLQLVSSDAAALARELPEGTSHEGSYSAASTSFRLDGETDGQTVAVAARAGPGRTDLSVSTEGLRYASETESAELAISGSSIPLPEVTVGIGTATSGFSIPLLADDSPGPFAFQISLLDVELDEGLWNMVDPAGVLPRDPGAVVMDVSGEMNVEEDIDTTGMAGPSTAEVETVSLDRFLFALAEAELMASGALDLLSTSDSDQIPVGQIDVVLTGVERLMERLIRAGILPQEQATGTRMMLGMFATRGEGEDELVSNIRFTEDGGVFVNGQPVR
jgi:hypothetical protein